MLSATDVRGPSLRGPPLNHRVSSSSSSSSSFLSTSKELQRIPRWSRPSDIHESAALARAYPLETVLATLDLLPFFATPLSTGDTNRGDTRKLTTFITSCRRKFPVNGDLRGAPSHPILADAPSLLGKDCSSSRRRRG